MLATWSMVSTSLSFYTSIISMVLNSIMHWEFLWVYAYMNPIYLLFGWQFVHCNMPSYIINDCAGIYIVKLIYFIVFEIETDVPRGKWSFRF